MKPLHLAETAGTLRSGAVVGAKESVAAANGTVVVVYPH